MKKIGIIGLGMASAPHARSLQDLKERVEVKAAFSPSAERRKAHHWGSDVHGDHESAGRMSGTFA